MTLLVIGKDLAPLRRAAIASVNDQAGAARGRYITIAPGQELVYLSKEAEGLRYLAAHPTPADRPADFSAYPFIVAELGITAADPWTLAQIWVQGAALFRQIGSMIETLRLGTVRQIELAPSQPAIEAALAGLTAGLDLLPDPPPL